MGTWITTACLIFETSYHVHTFYSPTLPFLELLISLWVRSVWCAVCELWCSESSSSPVQMSSTPCSIFKPKQKDWCTGHRLIWVCFHKNSYWSWLPTIALKLLPPTLLCLWLQVHHSFGLCLNSDHSLSFRLKVS